MFDSHAHYDDEKYINDWQEVILSGHSKGVEYILTAGSDIETSKRSIEIAEKFNFIYAAVGIHPNEAVKMNTAALFEIQELIKHPKVVAIGEIGLDYHYDFCSKEVQKECLLSQIEIAIDNSLPIIVHDREAHADCLDLILNTQAKGVFHCFTGSVEMAKIILKKEFYISFGGSLTFKNAKKTVEVAKYVPLDRIVVETDSPYMSPSPHRGKRNESSYVRYVIEKLAEIKDVSFDEVERVTTSNALNLFKIDSKNGKIEENGSKIIGEKARNLTNY